MIDCPRHGRLLYGTKCTDCDCLLARFHDGGVIPKGAVHMGFDLASGPDKTATAKVRRERVGDSYEFTVEEIDLMGTVSREHAEAMARHQRRVEEELARAIYGSGYANPFASRPDVTDPPWGAPPRRNAVEIITDPADRRGFDAKLIGGARP